VDRGTETAGWDVADSGAGNGKGPRRESELIALGFFVKADGLWVCDPKHPKCACAEGLAATLRTTPGQTNCLICSNWTPRVGCVLGYNLHLDEVPGLAPLSTALDQAHVWVEARNMGRAVARLEKHLRSHVDDAPAYFALAKLYDHPLYQGPDQRRAIILYQRFLELRGPVADDPDAALARRRIPILLRLPPPVRAHDDDQDGTLATFVCFFRFGTLTHVAYGLLTGRRFVLARAGDADPESGRTSVEMGQPFERKTRFLRWVTGEEPRAREMQLTRQEIERMALLPPDALARESRSNVSFPHEEICAVRLDADPGRHVVTVVFRTAYSEHALVFPADRKGVAEQCAALLDCLSARAQQHAVSGQASAAEASQEA
jgi:hypothetical protein